MVFILGKLISLTLRDVKAKITLLIVLAKFYFGLFK